MNGHNLFSSLGDLDRIPAMIGFHFFFTLGCLMATAPSGDLPMLKIFTHEPGVYKVHFEELNLNHDANRPLQSSRIGLFNEGKPVPIWLEDGGDGTFGPGDWFEFQADVLHGEHSFFHEYSSVNVFILSFEEEQPQRMQPFSLSGDPSQGIDEDHDLCFRGVFRMEIDSLLGRFRVEKNQPHELWFWHKLTCTDQSPFEQEFDLPDLNESGEFELRIGLRGWSQLPPQFSDKLDHVVHVSLNGNRLEDLSWDGASEYQHGFTELPVSMLSRGKNKIRLEVPYRKDAETGGVLIDVSLLNWLEIKYPKSSVASAHAQSRFMPVDSHHGVACLRTHLNEGVLAFGQNGSRWRVDGGSKSRAGRPGLVFQQKESAFFVTGPQSFKTILGIGEIPKNDLKARQRADYLVITHPTLRDEILPLVQLHLDRGLSVKVVDVFDIYNAFNHGIMHPKAIKAFLSYAYHEWDRPSPRFVLLVGDASWDTKNQKIEDEKYPDWSYYLHHKTRFIKNGSSFYNGAVENNRNLIPSSTFFMADGHAASDNYFVCVEGDDMYPDMAIGRFPVTTPTELRGIVEKTVRHVSELKVGPWRVTNLFITAANRGFVNNTEVLAQDLGKQGFMADKLYLKPVEADFEVHSRSIIDSLNEGRRLVYFYGHGGRYIWRTGRPDFHKKRDLFTLDHLDELENVDKLAVVMSFTCYSSPFDHPGADSIGEKFLRIPNAGAVGFIGASWRNTPTMVMNRAFMEAYSKPGTLGEALSIAKKSIKDPIIVETYCLLGDPAVPILIPSLSVSLSCREDLEAGEYIIEGRHDDRLWSGNGIVQVSAADGPTVHSDSFNFEKGLFSLKMKKTLQANRLVVYLWNEEMGKEAMGVLEVDDSAGSVPANDKNSRREL